MTRAEFVRRVKEIDAARHRKRCKGPVGKRLDWPRCPVVYFIKDGTGAVKIGRAKDLRTRFSSLQVSSVVPLVLLGYVHGGADKESEIHEKFRAYHLRGEWFLMAPEVESFIARAAKCPPSLAPLGSSR